MFSSSHPPEVDLEWLLFSIFSNLNDLKLVFLWKKLFLLMYPSWMKIYVWIKFTCLNSLALGANCYDSNSLFVVEIWIRWKNLDFESIKRKFLEKNSNISSAKKIYVHWGCWSKWKILDKRYFWYQMN